MNELGRLLLIFGVILAAVGLLLMFADRIPFVGRLPGDILVKKKNFTFYFPLATMILLSVILTVIINVLTRRQ